MQVRWRLLVLACVLASLFEPALVSASTGPYAETRVRGLDLENPYSVRAERAVTLDKQQGYGLGYDDVASGFLLAARGTRITMDQAVELGAHHVDGRGVMEVTGRGTNFQFRNTFENAAGDIETRIGRFDINPADPHVQQYGPHLNLETQINGVPVGVDPHLPIVPPTIRPGDFP